MWPGVEARVLLQGRQSTCAYKGNIDARFPCHCCREKAKCVTYSEGVSVALVTQHAT